MPNTIHARQLFTGTRTVEFPVVTLAADGTVASIDSDPQQRSGSNDILTPGYLDVHTHGAVGHDLMAADASAIAEVQRFLATRGVARYLPTTVTASEDATLRALERFADAIEAAPRPGHAQPVGIHLEGPFLSHAKRAVHPAHELRDPTPVLFDRFFAAARAHIRLMTIAPELPGAADLIAYAASRGVRASLGHSNATAAETLRGIEAGAASATHTFNAMRALDHREPGILGTVLDDDRLFAELICDGVHVAPAMVRLWWKAKGPQRAMLVTDSMAAAGMPSGDYALGPLTVRVDGNRALLVSDLDAGKETLAGSLLTMDRAVENFCAYTRADAAAGAAAASVTPAAMLGDASLAEIAVGRPGNFNRLDAAGRLLESYVGGKRVGSA